jgi:NADPH2:quinone reductase
MKAIRFDAPGGADQLKLVEMDARDPGTGEIRVKHHAIGVNFIDTYHRSGLYPMPLPSGVGLEAAGVVDAIGEGVTRFAVGDRVAYVSGPIGAYAQSHVVRAERAFRVPASVSFEIAAASALKGMTARYLLRKTFRVEQGHVVLIHAAAGGVGQIAVQWAKHLGAVVIATVGSDAKVEIAKKLGADHVIVSSREDIAKRVREIEPLGVHVVYDGVGKDTWDASLDSLRRLGMMVSYGNASGAVPAIAPLVLARKGALFLTRPSLDAYTATTAELDETAADLFEVIANGAVKIAPPKSYALADAAQAHRDLESRATTGSLVLTP